MPEMTNSLLQTPSGPVVLRRPGGGDKSLRAWDAADERLLEVAGQWLETKGKARILVVDDQFGALSLGLRRFGPSLVADSATLVTSLDLNAPGEKEPGDQVHSWLSPPEGPFDLVVLRIPRQSDYLAWLLRWVNGVLADDGCLLAGGMIKHLPDRSVDLFAEAVITEQVLPARKKARVVVCRKGQPTLDDGTGQWRGYRLHESLELLGLPAVFARERLDIGTRLLLPWIEEAVATLPSGAAVLDLACGNGVLGVSVLARRPDLSVTFTDVSSQAILSARRNVISAVPDAQAGFCHEDGLPAHLGSFDLILLNPPFHEGGVVGDHVALRLFRGAARHLSTQGRMLMVGNRHLGYHRSLKTIFSSVRQLDADPKFVVFEAGRS